MSNSISDFFKTDPEWNEVKKKTKNISTDKLLSRSEYLQLVGWDMYSEQAYKEYVKQFNSVGENQ